MAGWTFKAALLAFGRILMTLSSLLIAAFLSRFLSVQEYASYKQVFVVFNVSVPILALGLPESLLYFIPLEPGRSRQLLTTNVSMLFFAAVVFCFFVIFGGGYFVSTLFGNEMLGELLVLFLPYPLLVMPLMSVNAVLVSAGKVGVLTVFNIVNKCLLLVFVLGAVWLYGTVQAALIGASLSAAIILIPGLWLMYGAANQGPWSVDWRNARAQLSYSVPLGLASMLGVLSFNLDKLLVAATGTPEAFAIYANGAMQIPLVGAITRSVSAVLMPDFVSWYGKGELGKILEVWQSAMIKVAHIIFPVMIVLFGVAPELMILLYSDVYVGSSVPFCVYLLMLPIRITTFGSIPLAAGRSRVVMNEALVTLVSNTLLSLLLIRWFGSVGAAISTVLLVYCWSIPYYTSVIADILQVDIIEIYPWRALSKTMILACLAGMVLLLKFWLPTMPVWALLLVLGGLYGVTFFLLVWHFGVLPLDEALRWVRQRMGKKR